MLKSSSELVEIDKAIPLNDQVPYLLYNQNYEIDRNSFGVMNKKLGEGEFGNVFAGQLTSPNGNSILMVAVKIPKGIGSFSCVFYTRPNSPALFYYQLKT